MKGRGSTAIIARSMTGFGRGSAEDDNLAIQIELRSVNSRFLDCSFRLPRAYLELEGELRDRISSKISRGRIEIYLQRDPKRAASAAPTFNQSVFESSFAVAVSALKSIDLDTADRRGDLAVTLLSRKEVLDVVSEVADLGSERGVVFAALDTALDGLLKVRTVEGVKLSEDIRQRSEAVSALASKIKIVSEGTAAKLGNELKSRVQLIQPDVKADPVRLAQEIALIADRIDITEELVRLSSHLEQLNGAFALTPNGRKLEFLVQELGREFNTIGSKAQNAEVQTFVVEAKVELERMREQILNLE